MHVVTNKDKYFVNKRQLQSAWNAMLGMTCNQRRAELLWIKVNGIEAINTKCMMCDMQGLV